MNKYKNKKVEYCGIMFDSEMEKDFYLYLLQMFDKKNILIQPKFILQPSFRDENNKLIREISYTADFEVGNVVYDVKGMMTQQGEMRIKMFKFNYRNLILKVVTKAPKYTGKDWIEMDDLKKVRKEIKKLTKL